MADAKTVNVPLSEQDLKYVEAGLAMLIASRTRAAGSKLTSPAMRDVLGKEVAEVSVLQARLISKM